MRHLILTIQALLLCALPCLAQSLNDSADNVLGTYYVNHGDSDSKVSVTKASDGTYTAKVIWVADSVDKNGNKYLDVKNPDKSLRSVPVDQVVLIKGLKYIPEKKVWGDTKVYDPTRGIRANVTVKFLEDGRLSLRGQVLGIGETVYWKKITK